MERITKKQVEKLFQHFLKVTGRKPLASFNDVGGYFLEYNGIYGGFIICQMMENGGEATPLGLGRKTSREMWNCLHFALNCIGENR